MNSMLSWNAGLNNFFWKWRKALNQINEKHKLIPVCFWTLGQKNSSGDYSRNQVAFAAFSLGSVGAGSPDGRHHGEGQGASALPALLHTHTVRHRAPCTVSGDMGQEPSRAAASPWPVLETTTFPAWLALSFLPPVHLWAVTYGLLPSSLRPKGLLWVEMAKAGLSPPHGEGCGLHQAIALLSRSLINLFLVFLMMDDGTSQQIQKNDRLFLPYPLLVWKGS